MSTFQLSLSALTMKSNDATELLQDPATHYRRSPLTIAFLFYVVTLSAIIAAGLSHLSSDDRFTWPAFGASTASGAGFGLLTGLFVSLTRFKSLRANFLGIGIGTVLGIGAGAIAMVREVHFVSNMSITFVGCWLMILIMLAAARYQHRVE